MNFYPRSPCGERLRLPTALRTPHQRFLSTLSLRRATSSFRFLWCRFYNFYPRSPCGERPLQNWRKPHGQKTFLSTLSLRRATSALWMAPNRPLFLSTLSLRRATIHYDNYNLHCVISIHALLAESDSKSAQNSGALLRI